MKYVVQHEINGIRVKKNDPIDLFEKLISITTQPELYNRLSENARKTIAEKYDIKNYIIQLNEIYHLALIKT
jgi:glycosyltransferase involved in cell wall biosynthesis